MPGITGVALLAIPQRYPDFVRLDFIQWRDRSLRERAREHRIQRRHAPFLNEKSHYKSRYRELLLARANLVTYRDSVQSLDLAWRD